MTTFEELDALPTRELHDRAVKRAEHRLDVKFFWRLRRRCLPGSAARGDLDDAEEDALHWSKQMLEVLRKDEAALEVRRPIYIDYLLGKHSE